MDLTAAAAQISQRSPDRVLADSDLYLVDQLQEGNCRLIWPPRGEPWPLPFGMPYLRSTEWALPSTKVTACRPDNQFARPGG